MNSTNSRGPSMRLLGLSLLALCLTSAQAAGAVLNARAESLDLAPGTNVEGPDPQFKDAFTKLIAKKDKAEMAKLVKSRLKDAVEWTVYSCEQISQQSSDDLETFMGEMREAWTTSEKTDFAEKIYKYFSTVSGANKKDRLELKKRYDKAYDELQTNLQKKDSFTFQNILDEFEVLANAFDQVGDLYNSSQAWLAAAACCDEAARGQSADLYRACGAYMHALEARDKIELKDPAYEEALHRKAALVSKGFDKKKATPAPQEPQAPQPQASVGGPNVIPMTFEIVGNIDTYQRPNYMADEIYVIWNPIQLKAKGTSGSLYYIPSAPLLFRVAAADLRFDTDGDGAGDEKINISGNIAPIKIMIGKGEEQRPWAFLGVIGGDKENYGNLQVNVAPDDKQYTVYTFSAASIVGMIGTTQVRVIDDSMDGNYGSQVELRGSPGISKDNFEPAIDSIVLGTSKRARPWSEYQEIDGKWYRLEVMKFGKELKASPVNLETGVMKLDFKGPTAPDWVVVHGDGEQKNSFFDLVEGGAKGINVPVGKYSLSFGDVRKGKKKQTQKALMLPGKSTTTWTVAKGQTTVVSLGAPFGFDFKFGNVADKLTLEGRSVVITGSQGERYERTWNCVAKPEVEWRQKGTKQSKKGGRMTGVLDTDLLYKLGWEAAWSPIDLEFKAGGDKIELQLVDKQHPLFGKIESAWKD